MTQAVDPHAVSLKAESGASSTPNHAMQERYVLISSRPGCNSSPLARGRIHLRRTLKRQTAIAPLQPRAGPYISLDDVLQNLAVEGEIGYDPLEPGVLLLELPQSLHLRRQQAAILVLREIAVRFLFRFTPVEIRGLADPGLAAHLRDRNPFLALLQYERLLCVRELRCLHRFRSIPAWDHYAKTPASNEGFFGEQVTSKLGSAA